MAGGAMTNRPAPSGNAEKNVAAMAFDVLEPGFFEQWATSSELSMRLILGKTIKGVSVKGLTKKILQIQSGGYDYRVRINHATSGPSAGEGILHGRIDDNQDVTTIPGQYFDYAIYRPRLYQGAFQVGMQEMAQLDGDGVDGMDRTFDVMEEVTDMAIGRHWEDLEQDIFGYGFQNAGSVATPTATSGKIGFPGFGHMIDNANKSGVTSPEHMYGYIDASDTPFANWKAFIRNATGGLVDEMELYRTIRGCTYGSKRPTAIYAGEDVTAYIWALGVDKVRFINNAEYDLGQASGPSVCGIPVIPLKTMDLAIYNDTFALGAKYYKTIAVDGTGSGAVGDLDLRVQQAALTINENTLRMRAWRKLADGKGGPKTMSPLDTELKLGVIRKYAHLLTFGCTVRKFNGGLIGITGTGAP